MLINSLVKHLVGPAFFKYRKRLRILLSYSAYTVSKALNTHLRYENETRNRAAGIGAIPATLPFDNPNARKNVRKMEGRQNFEKNGIQKCFLAIYVLYKLIDCLIDELID